MTVLSFDRILVSKIKLFLAKWKTNWEISAGAKSFSAHFQAVFLFVYLRKKKVWKTHCGRKQGVELQKAKAETCNAGHTKKSGTLFFNGKKKRQTWKEKKKKTSKQHQPFSKAFFFLSFTLATRKKAQWQELFAFGSFFFSLA